MSQSKITTDLVPDDPIVLNAEYNRGNADRRKIDTQILATQRHVADSLLAGCTASWFLLSTTSAALAPGDVFCLRPELPVGKFVTRGTLAALAAAGTAIGLAATVAAPNTKFRGIIHGVVPPALFNLGPGAAGPVVVNGATGRLVRSASPGPTDVVFGFCDTLGAVVVTPSAAAGASAGIVDLDLTYAPAGLWQFNGDLLDTSGHGLNLSATTGVNPAFTDIYPGVRGYCSQGSNPRNANHGGPLQIFGNMTIEMLISGGGASNNARSLVSFASKPWGSSSDNSAYEICQTGYAITWKQQHGNTGAEDKFVNLGFSLPNDLCHLAATRTSGVIQFYLNGRTFGPASAELPAPDGGENSFFGVPNFSDNQALCLYRSLKVIPSALTAAQIKGEYNRSLGGLFGAAP